MTTEEFEIRRCRNRIKLRIENKEYNKLEFNLRLMFKYIKKLYPSYAAWVEIAKIKSKDGGRLEKEVSKCFNQETKRERKEAFLRKVNDVTYNMDLDEYVKVFGTTLRFNEMATNFFSWFCKLDSENVVKFLDYLETK